jgi:ABC-2 type transport system permease protein
MTRRQQLDVVRELALSDFRVKYHDSALGYLWSMLSPLLMFAVFYLVFRHVLEVRIPGHLPYLAVGLVYWTFFQDCASSGVTSLASKATLVKAVHLPATLVVGAAALSTMITLVINTALLVVGLAWAGRLSLLTPLALVPLLGLVLFATGVAFLVALGHVHFRDTPLILTVLLQAGFWLTPVVYHVTSQSQWELLHLSPLARCLTLLRWFLVYGHLPPLRFVLVTLGLCLAVFALGLYLFAAQERRIPESL